ncbi:MAG: class I SAM-dependent methyltransferase [Planctomycetes bacterium]|nr:class I SAM-dependent methyltransferase [Planctomycetota bacterium]
MEQGEYDKILEVEERNWWYRARRHLIAKWLRRRRVEVGRPLEILDVACAAGMSFRHFAEFGRVRGIDLSSETVRLCRERGIDRVVQCDAQRLPFRDESFDVVLSLDALEHLPDDAAGIAEIARVARHDALLLVTVPAFMFLWSPHDVAFHHHRRYVASELRQKLSAGGLAVRKLSYYSTSVLPPVWLLRKWRGATAKAAVPAHSDFFLELPGPLETLLYAVMRAEIGLMDFVSLPFGVSLFAACERAR